MEDIFETDESKSSCKELFVKANKVKFRNKIGSIFFLKWDKKKYLQCIRKQQSDPVYLGAVHEIAVQILAIV